MRVLTEDKIVEVVTIVKDRRVSYDEIYDAVRVDYEDHDFGPPWENCDGWEHEFHGTGYYDHPNASQRTGYVNRSARYGGCGHIEIDDDTIKGWGRDGYAGCSKQVRAEMIAATKREALDQLVKWYEDGWEWFYVCGEYDGYVASLGGIDCRDYAEEVRREIADEIADKMESDGYIVEDRPPAQPEQTAIDRYRQRKEWQQKAYNPGNRSNCAKHGKRYSRHISESIARSLARWTS